jgi:hypothetical protein
MAFDQDLVASVRTALTDAGVVREVKMFDGIGFMLNGNLIAAASKRGLLVRLGKDRQGDALAQPGARACEGERWKATSTSIPRLATTRRCANGFGLPSTSCKPFRTSRRERGGRKGSGNDGWFSSARLSVICWKAFPIRMDARSWLPLPLPASVDEPRPFCGIRFPSVGVAFAGGERVGCRRGRNGIFARVLSQPFVSDRKIPIPSRELGVGRGQCQREKRVRLAAIVL